MTCRCACTTSTYDMPDELIVLMVDKSTRIAEQLACTNIILRMRLRYQCRHGLRFCCINSSDALRFERHSQLHVGELVLTGSEFAQIPWAIWRIAMIRHHLHRLHTIKINPDFAPAVAEMYESLGETSE